MYQELVYPNLRSWKLFLQVPVLHLSPAPAWFSRNVFFRSAFFTIWEPGPVEQSTVITASITESEEPLKI